MAEEKKANKEETIADFTTINPEELAPELKQLYKSMQADYTRKTQDLSTRRQEYMEKETQWEDKLKSFGAAEQELTQWRDWYKSLSENENETTKKAETQTLAKSQELSYLQEPGQEELRKHLEGLQTSHSTEVKTLQEEIRAIRATLKDTTDQTSRMFNYHAQLNELGSKYKGLNKQELLDYALKSGQPDLERAYKDLHQDDLIEAEVARRLEDKVKEQRTQGIRGPGQQVILRSKQGTPKSFDEANEQILQERAAQGLY